MSPFSNEALEADLVDDAIATLNLMGCCKDTFEFVGFNASSRLAVSLTGLLELGITDPITSINAPKLIVCNIENASKQFPKRDASVPQKRLMFSFLGLIWQLVLFSWC